MNPNAAPFCPPMASSTQGNYMPANTTTVPSPVSHTSPAVLSVNAAPFRPSQSSTHSLSSQLPAISTANTSTSKAISSTTNTLVTNGSVATPTLANFLASKAINSRVDIPATIITSQTVTIYYTGIRWNEDVRQIIHARETYSHDNRLIQSYSSQYPHDCFTKWVKVPDTFQGRSNMGLSLAILAMYHTTYGESEPWPQFIARYIESIDDHPHWTVEERLMLFPIMLKDVAGITIGGIMRCHIVRMLTCGISGIDSIDVIYMPDPDRVLAINVLYRPDGYAVPAGCASLLC
jgi:hypothetical protein